MFVVYRKDTKMRAFNYFKFILFSVLLISLSSCEECIEGTGNIITEEFELSEFDNLSISVPANVIIKEGEKPTLRITTYESYMIAINKTVSGKRLDLEGNFCFAENEEIKIQITIPNDLEVIVVNGSANVHSDKSCKSDELDVKVNGSGNISLNIFTNRVFSNINGTGSIIMSGTCQKLSLGIAGSGIFRGKSLNTYEAKISIAGSGQASVIAFNDLDATVNGSGIINYSGNPDIDINISGSGKVNKID